MVRAALFSGFDAVRSRYGERIQRLCRKAGLEGLLLTLTERVEVALAETRRVSVGGADAEFYLRSHSELARLAAVERERAVIERLLETLEPGEAFYDVGSNVATHSCLVCNTVGETEAVAIEAHPDNARRSRENLSLNDVPARTVHAALTAEEGHIELDVDPGGVGQGKHRLLDGDETSGADTIQVPTIPGDDLVDARDLPTPNVLKIDVEGAELEVIRGFSTTLGEPTCRAVFCEVHPHLLAERGEDAETVEDLLDQLGFDTERFEERGTEYFIHASKRSQ